MGNTKKPFIKYVLVKIKFNYGFFLFLNLIYPLMVNFSNLAAEIIKMFYFNAHFIFKF